MRAVPCEFHEHYVRPDRFFERQEVGLQIEDPTTLEHHSLFILKVVLSGCRDESSI
jgi:hypothetical protein